MFRLRRSPIGTERQRVVIDTDRGNEIDDQFAIVHAVLAADVLDVEALYAAPFTNDRATGPAEGVEQGYAEIRRLLDLLGTGARGPNPPLAQVADTVDRVRVHRGSESYLDGVTRLVESAAALDLVERGMAGQGARLTVIALAALTDVASAFLLEPRLSGRVLVVWLGGQPREAPSAEEFNLSQDPEAVRVVLDSGVPCVHIPCRGVASHLATTGVPAVDAAGPQRQAVRVLLGGRDPRERASGRRAQLHPGDHGCRRARQEGELVAVSDGYRESTASWREMLLDLRRRGLTVGPRLASADGALGFWAALRQAPSLQEATAAYEQFCEAWEAKYPKAVECLRKDKASLFSFYRFPAEHWTHLRTTNPIESTYATIRLRTRRTKGCGSRTATLTMVWKLALEAEKTWRRLMGFKLIPLVIEGRAFVDGELMEAAA